MSSPPTSERDKFLKSARLGGARQKSRPCGPSECVSATSAALAPKPTAAEAAVQVGERAGSSARQSARVQAGPASPSHGELSTDAGQGRPRRRAGSDWPGRVRDAATSGAPTASASQRVQAGTLFAQPRGIPASGCEILGPAALPGPNGAPAAHGWRKKKISKIFGSGPGGGRADRHRPSQLQGQAGQASLGERQTCGADGIHITHIPLATLQGPVLQQDKALLTVCEGGCCLRQVLRFYTKCRPRPVGV